MTGPVHRPKQKLKIGIQGVRASFHDVVARQFFAMAQNGSNSSIAPDSAPVEITPVECSSFKLLCELLASGETDYAIMAIENSIAGSILTNYSLLERYAFKVIGEAYLRIELNLMALPGQSIDDIKMVLSHPMALLQCEEFLLRYPSIKVLETADTAESAKDIKEKQRFGHAAIASRLAAEVYGLDLLETGIETNKQNYTRFLAISRGERFRRDEQCNKSSIRFEVAHRPGSLVNVLHGFDQHGINMTKIQSVPILGRPYEYSFHVDLEWDDRQKYQAALRELASRTINLIHFGEYQRSERPNV